MALSENADVAAHTRRERTLDSFEPVLYDLVLTQESASARHESLAR
jgi:hypothetical protein